MKGFLKYVEITTKITSFFPFIMIIVYLLKSGFEIDITKTAVFFLSMLLFDLCTTAINNYTDKKELTVSKRIALFTIIVLLFSSTALGIWLVFLTDISVLILGIICFFCGFIYNCGPIPLSALPLGELFSGLCYGFFIPLILMYINVPSGFLYSFKVGSEIILTVNTLELLKLILICIAPIFATAGIMLANNICDVEYDIKIGRYTLAYYLKNKALILFKLLYFIIFISFIILIFLKKSFIFSLLFFIPVYKNIKTFEEKQIKEETFITSVKNYILVMVAEILCLAL
ncbi:MAG: prenyltransferase [Ruminococcaceae bacterium]|nr:prenyltransferase [Oscillospiraceae bacterium]